METTSETLSAEELQQQLDEKDQLIQALTDRLSEAAEQLDRVQRSGADKGGRPAGVPAEVFEQQRILVEKLTASLEQWEDVQPRSAFLRLEARLDHLRALLESASGAKPNSQPASLPVSRPTKRSDDPPRTEAPAMKPAAGSAKNPLSGWEAMKAQLMGSGSGPEQQPASTVPGNDPKPASTEPSADHDRGLQQPEPTSPAEETASSPAIAALLLADVEFPAPVDFEKADREELEQAIEVRDRFIGDLLRRLRVEQQRTREPIDWAALNNAPDELRRRLESLEAELEERRRIAEVELSLERARLSRVQSRTEELQRQIESRLKSGKSLHSLMAKENDRTAADAEQGAPTGWLRSFRRK